MKLLLIFVFAGALLAQPKAPEQPIPYSHKTHIGDVGLTCKDCHTNPDPGNDMVIPAAAKCMTCHATIKKESPSIQKLAAFARDKQEVPWVRVYKVPDWVYFSHRSHLDKGVVCADCHGQVETRDQIFKEKATNMAACIACHREKNAGQECTFCHESRE